MSLPEAPEVESVTEIGSAPEAGIEGPSLDSLRAELEQASTALRTSEDLRQQLNTQLDDAEARVKAAEVALERERVARRFSLPDELAGFLRGETAEDLAAEAETLSRFAPANGGVLGAGGLDPTDGAKGGFASKIAARVQRDNRDRFS
ncbi:hypothetical protein [Streptomyces sp. NBC_01304]|uniref:hypothetical protein n=1 Tax=Streptomyces sp. NBC_01304 TaxID=2903818 RepID=UPI002E10238B|nr:hypothetical protein OG430_42975 [Streptomyces sp. NBC_01304]